MKHWVINKDRIIEAYANEPYDIENDRFGEGHGWQVIVEIDKGNSTGNGIIIIDMESEQDCIYFINRLEMLPIKSTK